MKRLTTATAPADAKTAARKDHRIVTIHEYPDGWVPNSYSYRAPGLRRVFQRNGSGHWIHVASETVDRKRSGGNGPRWVALTRAGGRVASA